MNISVMRAMNITHCHQIVKMKSAWWTEIKSCVI